MIALTMLFFSMSFNLIPAAAGQTNKIKAERKMIQGSNLIDKNTVIDLQNAITVFQEALSLFRQSGLRHEQSRALNFLGYIKNVLNEKSEALAYYNQAFSLAGTEEMKGILLNNIGEVYDDLGDYDQALENYKKSLPLRRNQIGKSLALNNIGDTLANQGKFSEGIAYLERAYTAIKNSNAADITNRFKFERRKARILINLGRAKWKTGEKQEAVRLFLEALRICEKINDSRGIIKALNQIGRSYLENGETDKSFATLSRALYISQHIDDTRGMINSLSNLAYYWQMQEDSHLAIILGKQAVNLCQNLRRKVRDLDEDIQRAFIRSLNGIYRQLADWLIEKGRIAEAEQVLAMLKEEEVFAYLRREDKIAGELLQTISFSDKETTALKKYDEHTENITALGKEFGELDAARKNYPEGKFPFQARYNELENRLAEALKTFQKILEELKIEFGNTKKNEEIVKIDSGVQATLLDIAQQQAARNVKVNQVAVVSTIIGENRLNIIVTTANAPPVAHKIDKTEKEINQLVINFRQALINPGIDPRPAAQELYDILVKPIEGDLTGIAADTILWSLDGSLRYIPTAALWDKEKGYLVERFANVMITLASHTKLIQEVKSTSELLALGVGVSKPIEGFTGLTAVPDELDCIITDAQIKTVSPDPVCESGVIDGKKLLDESFTLTAFKDALGRYSIVHIASHFNFIPGNDKDSFLLLGGGGQKRYTVEELFKARLNGVELFVLSACNTATPGGLRTSGVEIEGFGMVAQKQGAKAVMATLWAVADNSTRDLMVKFYDLYGKKNLTKAEAVRQAQLAMVYGKYKPGEGNTIRGTKQINLSGGNKPQFEFKTDNNARYSHPYYWSPFILIGNWR